MERSAIVNYTKNSNDHIDLQLIRKDKGFGFNIVGGVDRPHIPGFNGFFVSRVGPNCESTSDVRLEVGDLIISVNGIILANKTHDEAVDLFRASNDSCVLHVEKHAERRILNSPMTILPSPGTSSTNMTKERKSSDNQASENSNLSGVVKSPKYYSALSTPNDTYVTAPSSPFNGQSLNTSLTSIRLETNDIKMTNGNFVDEKLMKAQSPALPLKVSDHSPELTPLKTLPIAILEQPNSNQPKRQHLNLLMLENNDVVNQQCIRDDKNLTEMSYTSLSEQTDNLDAVSVLSVTNINDDLQKTPKHNINCSPFDLSHNSMLTEVLIVTLGTVALGAAIFVAYRFARKH